ncbi:ribonuclease VapC [Labrys miyagiensis]|uniref:Ribonuclease VapC n=1 Tax=Labrys miyagiensis TaxID=346912 RepID=A0ABQ6CYL1_9HYPH|nr:ribonuclease VapC [Labrys miyagiensis]
MSCVNSHSQGHANVRRWISTVPDADLRLSAATLYEQRRGAESLRRRDPDRASRILTGIEALEKSYASRVVPIDAAIVAEWTRLLAGSAKDRWDLALVATAKVHDFTIVTRNIKDFQDRGARLLNPFHDPPRKFGT